MNQSSTKMDVPCARTWSASSASAKRFHVKKKETRDDENESTLQDAKDVDALPGRRFRISV